MNSLSLRKNVLSWGVTLVMLVISICFLIPLIWMISAAFKYEKDVLVFPIQWIPEQVNVVANFKMVWMSKIPFGLFYLNSFKLAIISTMLTIIISSLAAYAFSKLEFPLRNTIFAIVVSLLIIPEHATLVPRYVLIKWLGLYNTHAAIILMGAFSIYFTFLIRQFMVSIHTDYLEAAKIDGAGYFRIYWQIMVPLCKPILATVGIIKFIWAWNDYQSPLIFLFDPKLYPIPLGIQYFKELYNENYAILMMASLSAILPLLLIFIVLQRQVINGISLGGVKG